MISNPVQQAIIKTMAAEFNRQADEADERRGSFAYTSKISDVEYRLHGDYDLEKVLQAVLRLIGPT